MKKVVFGVLVTIGVSVWSYGAEVAHAKYFMGAACSKRSDSVYGNAHIMQRFLSSNGLSQELLDYFEKGANSVEGCSFIGSEDVTFNVLKKTKEYIYFKKGGDKVLVHSALVTISKLGGKSLKELTNDDKLAKVLLGVKLWISRPYFNENNRKIFPLFKFKNGETW